MAPDPEKNSAPATAETFSSDSSDGPSSPVLELIKTSQSRRSTAAQRQEDDEDLYETLQRAITPDVETDAERWARDPISHVRTTTSVASAASRLPDFEVIFEENDPENPKNWPLWYRAWAMFVVSFCTWVIVLYSTSYTSSTPGLMKDFNSSTTIVTLGLTTYLLGLAAGSLIVAPMSELYGRRIVYITCLAVWSILIIPCGLAKSLTAILIVRFFG
jgi:hypothetical protein